MRLITRSDFDGLACGALLEALGLVTEWQFVHPKDIQDGLVTATANDIVANVPYIKGCKLWFDHHSSEAERLGRDFQFDGESRPAPSCARVIYEYYGGDQKLGRFREMVEAADKMDSAQLSREEILHPAGWVLLGFIADPRTGLGRFRNFRISNYDLMKALAASGLTKTVDEILALPDVRERIEVYREQEAPFAQMIKTHARVNGNVVAIDLRGVDPIHAGNRFVLYTLFPEQNVSVWVVDGKQKANVVITVGHSILNRSSTADVGSLMLRYGGGGHRVVGTCQVPYNEADRVIGEIMEVLK